MHDLDDGSRAGSGSRAFTPSRSRRSRQTAALFEALVAAADAERDGVRQEIVLLNTGVALAVARRYHGRGIDAEDLDQAACLALVQAVRTFDPARGHDFMSYAVPTIVGGVKQHFRDLGWTIRVPRRVQEVQLLIDREGLPEADEIRYGAHTVTRLATHLHLTTREVEAALRARGCFSPASIDQEGVWPPTRALSTEGRLGTEEQEAIELRAVLAPLLERPRAAGPQAAAAPVRRGPHPAVDRRRAPAHPGPGLAAADQGDRRAAHRPRDGRACCRPRSSSKFVGPCTRGAGLGSRARGEEVSHRRLSRHRRSR